MAGGVQAHVGARCRWWRDRIWPLLTGPLTVVGARELADGHGLAGLVLVPAWIWIVSSTLLHSVVSDLGYPLGWSLRAGLETTAVVVAVLGSLSLSVVVGATATILLALTSPWTLDALAPRTRRSRVTSGGGLSPEQTDERFAEIVADLERDSTWPDG